MLNDLHTHELRATLNDTNNPKQEITVSHTYCPILGGAINNVNMKILVDTGSEVSVISRNKNHFKHAPVLLFNNYYITTATKIKQIATQQIYVNFKCNELVCDIPMIVVDKLTYDCIIGIDVLNKLGAVINLENNSMTCKVEGRLYEINLKKVRTTWKQNRNLSLIHI